MFCSTCGKEINEKAAVCVGCGCAVSAAGKPVKPEISDSATEGGGSNLAMAGVATILAFTIAAFVVTYIMFWIFAPVGEVLLSYILFAVFAAVGVKYFAKNGGRQAKKIADATMIVLLCTVFVFLTTTVWIVGVGLYDWYY